MCMNEFKPQGWHVEKDGVPFSAFSTRLVAEEFTNEMNTYSYRNRCRGPEAPSVFTFCLCDCEDRDCKYMVRIAGL